MPVCPVCRSQNMETAKFCGNCGNPFPRISETTSSLRKCEQGHIYSAVYQACPYCPQGNEAKKESMSFETRIEEIPSFGDTVAAPAPADFMTRIDAPIPAGLPSFPNLPSPAATPNFASPNNDLATRIESPIPSEFMTRLEEPIPDMVTRLEEPMPDMVTRIEELPPPAPTFDFSAAAEKITVPPMAEKPVAPAALPRTELLGDDPIFVTKFETPPAPPSMLDLNWPTPPPMAGSPTVTGPLSQFAAPEPAEPSHFSAPPATGVSAIEIPLPAAPPPVVAPPIAPPTNPPALAFSGPLSQGANRSTMMMSAEDLKKQMGSKGKLVGWLVSYARTPDGEDFKLHSGYNRIGANPACDIVVEDDTVSGSHAIIVFRDGRYLIKDDLSRNGTFVNGKEITEAYPLQNYDQVRVGNTTLVFVAAQKF